MHFTSIEVTDDNHEHHQWYQMQMKTDFQIRVEAYGFLPNSTLSNKFATMREIQYFKGLEKSLQPEKTKEKKALTAVESMQISLAKTLAQEVSDASKEELKEIADSTFRSDILKAAEEMMVQQKAVQAQVDTMKALIESKKTGQED